MEDFKNIKTNNKQNWRISNTVSKLCEYIISVGITDYFHEHKIIPDRRFGLKISHSNTDMFAKIVEETTTNFDLNYYSHLTC